MSCIRATCVLEGTVKGTISFEQNGADSPCKVTGTVTGLKEGNHGFHIHEFGDYTGGCGTTGGHFNPHNKDHAGPNDTERHIGDLGNIVADANGIANVDITDSVISLTGEHSIVGRAVVVHEGEDDLGRGGFEDSKKTGHAGGRLSCGVIGIGK